jgi:hypothetical protein
MAGIYIDGDFASGKGDCKHHCSPTCHPAQIGPEWLYGCLHPAWPMNKAHDFCPIVRCGGDKMKCELIKSKVFHAYKRGLTARLNNAIKKLDKIKAEKEDMMSLSATSEAGKE